MHIPHAEGYDTVKERSAVPQIFLIGLNYRTVPLTLREQMARTDDDLRRELAALPLDEAAILSTCNRLEIYGVTQDVGQARADVMHYFQQPTHHTPELISRHLYIKEGRDAAAHLMRVASGLDSMILGEAQILGQVQQAFALAQSAGSAGPVLSHWFAQAAHAGKRARTETDVSRHVTSISHAAVRLAQSQVNLRQARALVVGSGEMAHLAAQALHRHGVRAIRVVNRTYARAADLARAFDGEALDWEHLPDALAEADVVISATRAPHSIIHLSHMQRRHDQRLLVLIDIALPRDVDAEVRKLPGVRYYDLDDLNAFVEANLAKREASVADVVGIVEEETTRFMEWYQGRSITPVITALREKAEALAQHEVEAALRRLGDLDAGQQRVVELMAHRIVSRILHEPTVRLKAAHDSAMSYESVVRDLFALDEGETTA
jgi:glutamyl-tRNA reductase